MAKIHRISKHNVGQAKKEIRVDYESGDVYEPVAEPWSNTKVNDFTKCVSLTEQIVDKKINLVDASTLTAISYSLALFGDKGKSLFDQLCLFQTEYSTEQLNIEWSGAIRKTNFKTPGKFIRLCREKGLEIKINEDEGWEYKIKELGKSPYVITDELTESIVKEIQAYGFIERNKCYYFADFNLENKVCTLIGRSNFVLRILFHINRGKENKRVIELENMYGRKITTDIETNQLASFQKFKELTEGSGNFLFEGTVIDLGKIKTKLFKEEKPSQQIDMLGWNKAGKFFSFSNGLYTSEFNPVDDHGIVTLNGKNYFIPYHPGTDEYSNQNEKLFCYKPGTVSFGDWAEAYCKSFGDTGKVSILFGIATLFSDHIFHVRRNFPMLFLYGEGGSGKSRVGTYLQYLWGDPQPPLKLSDKANTDKARIRKMAQYINSMALFEEFINELDMSIIKTITGVYDRFGYERSNMLSKYGTETVPINSTAFITGNSYPNDDPLMQRLILIDYNKNVRDAETVEAYNKLTQINRDGLTHLTGYLLQFREYFAKHFESEFDKRLSIFKELCKQQGINVPDRMCENYAVIIATNEVMRGAGIELPFHTQSLTDFLIRTISAQSDKRDVGSVTQRFWDILLQLASESGSGGKPIIKAEKEYKFNGAVLSIRWTEIHGLYMEKHQKLYRTPGLGKSTMLQKLKDSGAMITDAGDSEWIGGKTCHVHRFEYAKLGIDLISVMEHWRSEEKRFYPKEPRNEQENLRNLRNLRNPENNVENSFESEKQPNKGENDDLPF
jgi:hypothetical protein